MGPESAKSFAGQRVVRALPDLDGTKPAPSTSGGRPIGPERAKQEIDYGRRGKGYIFGAFKPADGEAFTESYGRRTTANHVDTWIAPDVGRIYGIADNLNAHRAVHVLLFSLSQSPQATFVFTTEVCGIPEPHRALVESRALAGAQGSTFWDLG